MLVRPLKKRQIIEVYQVKVQQAVNCVTGSKASIMLMTPGNTKLYSNCLKPLKQQKTLQTAVVAEKNMSDSDKDAELVKRVQHGDKRAYDLLVLKYQHKIHSLVSRFVREADVPDVAQEAFIKAYKAIGNFRAESAFYTWLYRIAVNTAKNHLVSRSRRPPDSDVDIDESDEYSGANVLQDLDTPINRLQAEDMAKTVRQALDTLPNDLRTAVTLREFDGLSYDAIADIMDCPVGTVRSRIFRAREAIDNAIRPLIQNQ